MRVLSVSGGLLRSRSSPRVRLLTAGARYRRRGRNWLRRRILFRTFDIASAALPPCDGWKESASNTPGPGSEDESFAQPAFPPAGHLPCRVSLLHAFSNTTSKASFPANYMKRMRLVFFGGNPRSVIFSTGRFIFEAF